MLRRLRRFSLLETGNIHLGFGLRPDMRTARIQSHEMPSQARYRHRHGHRHADSLVMNSSRVVQKIQSSSFLLAVSPQPRRPPSRLIFASTFCPQQELVVSRILTLITNVRFDARLGGLELLPFLALATGRLVA